MQEYEFLEVIGRGSYGTVWKVCHKKSKELFAIKEIDFFSLDSKDRQLLVNEISILKRLESPYIVKYINHSINKEKGLLHIIMEYCSGGDLSQYIKETKRARRSVSEDQIWLTLTELTLALDVCHQSIPKIIHRDIKPPNVFIDSAGHIKIGDFGLAKRTGEDLAKTVCGTPYYMSPEICNRLPYDEKSDIWAVGCIIYEMCTLSPPFKADSREDLMNKISNSEIQRISASYSSSLNSCVQDMLCKDPLKRPSTQKLLSYRMIHITHQILTLNEKRRELRKKTERLKEEIAKTLGSEHKQSC